MYASPHNVWTNRKCDKTHFDTVIVHFVNTKTPLSAIPPKRNAWYCNHVRRYGWEEISDSAVTFIDLLTLALSLIGDHESFQYCKQDRDSNNSAPSVYDARNPTSCILQWLYASLLRTNSFSQLLRLWYASNDSPRCLNIHTRFQYRLVHKWNISYKCSEQ